jgi:hypothetical protein
MVEHVFHSDQRTKRCDKVTRWMKEYMATLLNIERRDFAKNVIDDTSGKEGNSSQGEGTESATEIPRKRKALEDPENPDDSLSVSIGGAARTLFELQKVNGVLSFNLNEHNTKAALSTKKTLTEIRSSYKWIDSFSSIKETPGSRGFCKGHVPN